jgi:hypothetical protein
VALHKENTARLWDKAKRMDAGDIHWWEIVRKEIEAAISRISEETVDLYAQIKTLEIQPTPQSLKTIPRDN